MKSLTASDANGNFIGVCTGLTDSVDFCGGIYNVDQFYDKTTNTQEATGPCAGSIAVADVFAPVPYNQPVSGGTGAYKGASGTVLISTINDSAKCPKSATLCYKIDFNLD